VQGGKSQLKLNKEALTTKTPGPAWPLRRVWRKRKRRTDQTEGMQSGGMPWWEAGDAKNAEEGRLSLSEMKVKKRPKGNTILT